MGTPASLGALSATREVVTAALAAERPAPPTPLPALPAATGPAAVAGRDATKVPLLASKLSTACFSARARVGALTMPPAWLARFKPLLARPWEKTEAQPVLPAKVPSAFWLSSILPMVL